MFRTCSAVRPPSSSTDSSTTNLKSSSVRVFRPISTIPQWIVYVSVMLFMMIALNINSSQCSSPSSGGIISPNIIRPSCLRALMNNGTGLEFYICNNSTISKVNLMNNSLEEVYSGESEPNSIYINKRNEMFIADGNRVLKKNIGSSQVEVIVETSSFPTCVCGNQHDNTVYYCDGNGIGKIDSFGNKSLIIDISHYSNKTITSCLVSNTDNIIYITDEEKTKIRSISLEGIVSLVFDASFYNSSGIMGMDLSQNEDLFFIMGDSVMKLASLDGSVSQVKRGLNNITDLSIISDKMYISGTDRIILLTMDGNSTNIVTFVRSSNVVSIEYYCFGIRHNENSVCNGNGVCVSQDACSCNGTYIGRRCQIYTCFGLVDGYGACYGNGKCVGPNNCQCYPTYQGRFCQIKVNEYEANYKNSNYTSQDLAGYDSLADDIDAKNANLPFTNFYITERGMFLAEGYNNRVRKIDLSTNKISTMAGVLKTSGLFSDMAWKSLFNYVYSVYSGPDSDYLFVVDQGNHAIRRIFKNYYVDTLAGTGTAKLGDEGAIATYSTLYFPKAVREGDNGDIYVLEYHRIRKIDYHYQASGVLNTVAGRGVSAFAGDGLNIFDNVENVAFTRPNSFIYKKGEFYIADSGNNRIRKIDSNGVVSTIVGNGGTAETFSKNPLQNGLNNPSDIIMNEAGELFIVDTGNNRIKKLSANGTELTIVAGCGQSGFDGDGGSALDAKLSAPSSVGFYNDDMYIGDAGNFRIRKMNSQGNISTFAGYGSFGFKADHIPARESQLYEPTGVLFKGDDLLIADSKNKRIRAIRSGIISTLVGNGNSSFSCNGTSSIQCGVDYPSGLALTNSGDIIFTDTTNNYILQMNTSSSVMSIISGIRGIAGFEGDGLSAKLGKFNTISSVVVSPNGEIYISDTKNNRIRKFSTTGVLSTIAGSASSGSSGDGGLATSAKLNQPSGLFLDSNGELYIADEKNHKIRRIKTNGYIETVIGTGISGCSPHGATVSSTMLNSPKHMLVVNRDILVLDSGNNRVIKFNLSSKSTISVVIGANSTDTLYTSLSNPNHMTYRDGQLIIADSGNSIVKSLMPVCYGIEAINPFVCSGNGSCLSPNNCTCDSTHFGYDCSMFKCYGIFMDDEKVCSGNGRCSNVDTCECKYGWTGQLCNITIPGQMCSGIFNYTSSVCSGRGQCVSNDICICNYGYTGDNCEFHSCYGISSNSSKVCSSKGKCTSIDNCTCNAGYVGDYCQTISCYGTPYNSPTVCTGRGDCTAANTCKCRSGYSGTKCEAAHCDMELSPLGPLICSNHGSCVDINICKCDSGYYGVKCQVPMCSGVLGNDSTVCSGHGTCSTPDLCSCVKPYYGDNCQYKELRYRMQYSALQTNISGLNKPKRILLENGEFLIADTNNHRIMKITLNGTMEVIAGIPNESGYSGDGNLATLAKLNSPQGIILTDSGDLYIADTGNSIIRRVHNGIITTVAGRQFGGDVFRNNYDAIDNPFNSPTSVVVLSNGDVVFSENHKIIRLRDGKLSAIVGISEDVNYLTFNPRNLIVDNSDNIYYICNFNGRFIKKLTNSTGKITTLLSSVEEITSFALYKNEIVFSVRYYESYNVIKLKIRKKSPSGYIYDIGQSIMTYGIAVEDENMYILDYSESNIKKLVPFIPTCFSKMANDSNVCSQRGDCFSENSCTCDSPYFGNECTEFNCSKIWRNDAAVCSGNGRCESPDGCVCDQFHTGKLCEIPLCFGVPSNSSQACSRNGKCIGVDICSCSSNFTGDNCQYPMCFGMSSSNSSVCSGNGMCSSPDKCVCNEVFTGKKCDIPYCCSCLYNITSVGNITKMEKICECKERYFGLNCDVYFCNSTIKNDSRVCNGHGTCESPDICKCSSGFTGQYCELPLCSGIPANETRVCGGRGACITLDTCSCISENNTKVDGAKCENIQCLGENGKYYSQNHSKVCSGRGLCSYSGCLCDNGFLGDYCQHHTCDGILFSDSKVCNGKGQCISKNTCRCTSNNVDGYWTGQYCDECSLSHAGINCTEKFCNDSITCNNNGKCNQNKECECSGGWDGQFCLECKKNLYGNTCEIFCNAETNCSSNGLCNENGSCVCFEDSTHGYWNSSKCNQCLLDYHGSKCITKIVGPARLNDNGNGITFKLFGPEGINVFNCSKLFKTSEIYLYGTNPVCSWVNREESTFQVQFGDDYQLRWGMNISLSGNVFDVVGVMEEYIIIPVLNSQNPVKPVAFISNTRSDIGQCEDLIIDASQSYSGDRKMLMYHWFSIDGFDSPWDDLFMKDLTANSSLVIPSSINEGDYSIGLTVESSITGAISNSTMFSFSKKSLPLPIVSIQGKNSVNLLSSDLPYIFRPLISFPSCYYENRNVTIVWKRVNGSIESEVDVNGNLVVKSLIEKVESRFTLEVEVISLVNMNSKATSQVSVTIGLSELLLSCYVEEISVGKAVIITEFTDPDAANENELWVWTCREQNSIQGTCDISITEQLAMISNSRSLRFELEVGDNVKHLLLSLNVEKGKRSKQVDLLLSYPESLVLTPPLISLLSVNPSTKYITREDLFSLQVSISIAGVSDGIDIQREWLLNSQPISNQLTSQMFESPSASNSIILDSSLLDEGVSYTLTLNATSTQTKLSSTYSYTFKVARSPQSCDCSVSPTTGYVLDTSFLFQCINCQNEEHTIDFVYGYIDDKTNTQIPLYVLGDSFSSRLPPPNDPKTNQLQTFFKIVDTSTGASCVKYQIVSLTYPTINNFMDISSKIAEWNSLLNSQASSPSSLVLNSATISKASEVLWRKFFFNMKREVSNSEANFNIACMNGGVFNYSTAKCDCSIGFTKKDCSLATSDQVIKNQMRKLLVGNYVKAFSMRNTFELMSENYLKTQLVALSTILDYYDEIDSSLFSSSCLLLQNLSNSTLLNKNLRISTSLESVIKSVLESLDNYLVFNNIQNQNTREIVSSLSLDYSSLVARGRGVGQPAVSFATNSMNIITDKNYMDQLSSKTFGSEARVKTPYSISRFFKDYPKRKLLTYVLKTYNSNSMHVDLSIGRRSKSSYYRSILSKHILDFSFSEYQLRNLSSPIRYELPLIHNPSNSSYLTLNSSETLVEQVENGNEITRTFVLQYLSCMNNMDQRWMDTNDCTLDLDTTMPNYAICYCSKQASVLIALNTIKRIETNTINNLPTGESKEKVKSNVNLDYLGFLAFLVVPVIVLIVVVLVVIMKIRTKQVAAPIGASTNVEMQNV